MSAAVHDITWADHALVTDARITEVPRSGQTMSGYGGQIPTRYMLRYGSRWHRVYVMQYGNAGSPYIISRGDHLVLEMETEHLLQTLKEGVEAPTPINELAQGSRFRFHHDGVVATLLLIGNGRYDWHDYNGYHYLHTGTYRRTGRPAWPHVYPTTDPETEVKLP